MPRALDRHLTKPYPSWAPQTSPSGCMPRALDRHLMSDGPSRLTSSSSCTSVRQSASLMAYAPLALTQRLQALSSGPLSLPYLACLCARAYTPVAYTPVAYTRHGKLDVYVDMCCIRLHLHTHILDMHAHAHGRVCRCVPPLSCFSVRVTSVYRHHKGGSGLPLSSR